MTPAWCPVFSVGYGEFRLPSYPLIGIIPAINEEIRRQGNKFPLPEGQGGATASGLARRGEGRKCIRILRPSPCPLPEEKGITPRTRNFANGFREGSGDCTPGRKAS